MRKYDNVLMVSFAAILLGGCGLTTERIPIAYVSGNSAVQLRGADGVHLRVDVSDLRANPDELSKKGDEYDILAPILAANDVAEVLKQAIAIELARSGFVVDTSGVVVQVELSKFYNRFLGSKSVAELFMHVQVRDSNGGLRFSTLVGGNGVKSGIGLRSGDNAKEALDAAMKDAVHKLITDIRFTDALISAGKR